MPIVFLAEDAREARWRRPGLDHGGGESRYGKRNETGPDHRAPEIAAPVPRSAPQRVPINAESFTSTAFVSWYERYRAPLLAEGHRDDRRKTGMAGPSS